MSTSKNQKFRRPRGNKPARGGYSNNRDPRTYYRTAVPTVRLGTFRRPVVAARTLDVITYSQLHTIVAAASYRAIRFTPNAAYDVDPTLGSTSTVGFSELTNYYKRYKIHAYRYEVNLANLDAVPMNIYIMNLNFDPTVSSANFAYYSTNPLCRKRMLGSLTGNGVCTMRGTVRVEEVYGQSIDESDQFYGTDAAVPANLVWFAVGVQTADGSNMLAGVAANIKIMMDGEFFERKVLTA